MSPAAAVFYTIPRTTQAFFDTFFLLTPSSNLATITSNKCIFSLTKILDVENHAH
ncbi:hypothetical protein [Rubritalea tangerina]|uniref:hypothetical protein n=1 Tax=Rubritalea tangerina TaxID=430798 RepID=UPI003609AB19